MASLLSLPNELLFRSSTCSILSTPTFTSMEASRPPLYPLGLRKTRGCRTKYNFFKHIEFLEDDEGFQRLFRLAQSPLRQHVRVLSCCFEVYKIEDSTIDKKRHPSTFKNLVGLTATGLADTLRQFQNPRAIRIWQYWESSWFWTRTSAHRELSQQIPPHAGFSKRRAYSRVRSE